MAEQDHPKTAFCTSFGLFKFNRVPFGPCNANREYLLGHKCIVYIDNNTLSHLQSAKLGAAEHRWAAELAAFDLEIKYLSGCNNRKAYALSRQYVPAPHCVIPSLPGTSVLGSIQQNIQPGPMVGALKSLISILPSHSPPDLRWMQEEDPLLKKVLVFWRRGCLPTSAERKQLSHPAIVLLRQWDCLVEENGVLFWQVFRSDGGEEQLTCFARCAQGGQPASAPPGAWTSRHGEDHRAGSAMLLLTRNVLRYQEVGAAVRTLSSCKGLGAGQLVTELHGSPARIPAKRDFGSRFYFARTFSQWLPKRLSDD